MDLRVTRMDDLLAKLGICNLAVLVRERRLRWFGHVPGRKGPGRPKKMSA